jgi:hypothetical protein
MTKKPPATLNSLMYSAGGRRFLLTCVTGAVSTFLLWFAKIPPDTWRDVVIATVAVFIGANTVEAVKAPKP